MGAFLSKDIVTHVDTSADILAIQEVWNEQRLLMFIGGSVYAMMMIWSTTLLVDRWRGPNGDRPVRFASVLAGIIMSTAWPVVMIYLLLSNN